LLLPLDYQVRFANPSQGYLEYAPLDFDLHPALAVARQASFEKRQILDRLSRRDAGQSSGKPLEIGGLAQLTVETGRTDLQNVSGAGNKVFNVEKHAELFAYRLAIAMTDPSRLIDVNPQKSLLAYLPFNVNDFHSGRLRGAFGGLTYTLQLHAEVRGRRLLLQQKSGLAPTRTFDRLQRNNSIGVTRDKSKRTAASGVT
jgi:hypothetical protein